MPDPFEALRLPAPTTRPDPTFAARLRSQVQRSLALPEGVTVSDLFLETDPRPNPLAPPSATTVTAGIVPYLIVNDARRAIDWYVSAFGATRAGETITMPDGRIGHAELRLRDALFYLADESPDSSVAAPQLGAPATVSLTVEVPDVDGAVAQALSAGAISERPVADNPYGRNAVIRDPFGHRWIISALSTPAPADDETGGADDGIRQGDVGYVSLWVPDVDRATTFFSKVLGWSYQPAAVGHARQVVGGELPHGVLGGLERSSLFLCFAVDDIDAAVERVRAAGGEVHETTLEPFGRSAMCTDVEGTEFSMYQPPPGGRGSRLAANGSSHGDLSYITMEVQDVAAVRSFYGTVLGWTFSPGRVDDGWGIDDVVPMAGLHGGHDVTTVVPMYRVDDIHATVTRVRAAGGSATDPEHQPYGLSSQCVDDQGTRFYLGQH
jgi:predicted enzyme related to lactoylglutathione lyase